MTPAGTIPACAGSTQRPGGTDTAVPDRPRLRGAHSPGVTWVPGAGSAPKPDSPAGGTSA